MKLASWKPVRQGQQGNNTSGPKQEKPWATLLTYTYWMECGAACAVSEEPCTTRKKYLHANKKIEMKVVYQFDATREKTKITG